MDNETKILRSQKISAALKGRTLSDEHKKRLSESRTGRISNHAKSAIIVYKNKKYTFDSITKADEFFFEQFNLKTFYWFRRGVPKKYHDDVQLVKVKDIVKHIKTDYIDNDIQDDKRA